MNNISIYLSKYLNFGSKDKQIKIFFIESIKEISGIEVEENKIKISKNKIDINIQGPEKSEIFINKEKIKEKFEQKLNSSNLSFSNRIIL
jgi:hypothetical protein